MKIHTIPVLPFGMLNAYLIVDRKRSFLIDTGLPGRFHVLWRAIKLAGLDPQCLSGIVITHAHVDHAGGAHLLRQHTSAQVYAHRAELSYLRRETNMIFRPTGWFGSAFAKTGLIQAPYPPLIPDVVVEEDVSLNLQIGGGTGQLCWTPGHTPGSLSLVLETGDVFAGDLVASGILLGGIALRDKPKQPPFEEDSHQVASSLQKLLEMGCRRFYIGHGGPLDAEAVKRHIETLLMVAGKGR